MGREPLYGVPLLWLGWLGVLQLIRNKPRFPLGAKKPLTICRLGACEGERSIKHAEVRRGLAPTNTEPIGGHALFLFAVEGD